LGEGRTLKELVQNQSGTYTPMASDGENTETGKNRNKEGKKGKRRGIPAGGRPTAGIATIEKKSSVVVNPKLPKRW